MKNRKIVLPFLILIVAGIAGYFIYDSYMYVHSDDAQIDARTVMIASKVSGYITQVNVDIGESAKAGDILAKIDDRDYVNSVERAKADLESNEVRLIDAQKNFNRLASLYQKEAATQAQFEAAQAGLNDLKAKSHALKAQVTQAQLNLDYTVIRAPFDGYVAKRSAEIGQLVSGAAPLFGFVDGTGRWVTANLKETEIASIAPGSKVDITVDALSNKQFDGIVRQVSPSTGAAFTLIPPDNATGNFTKVVQRVPVKISFEHITPEQSQALRAGLSVDVKIHKHGS